MPRVHITSISQDVGHALCYLHQWQPHPIIHRDISSANVLLEAAGIITNLTKARADADQPAQGAREIRI